MQFLSVFTLLEDLLCRNNSGNSVSLHILPTFFGLYRCETGLKNIHDSLWKVFNLLKHTFIQLLVL